MKCTCPESGQSDVGLHISDEAVSKPYEVGRKELKVEKMK